MKQLMQDIIFAIRQLRRSPGFAVVGILTLSVGIGATTTVFSVMDEVLLRPLPFSNQERLVFPDSIARAGYQQSWSYLSYLDARAELKTFKALAGFSDFDRINLEGPSGPVSLRSVNGTDNFFNVFGVKPMLGRTYSDGEDEPGRDNVAVLSYEVWQTQFGRDKNAVGRVVRLNGMPYTIIGVMPAGFRFPLSARNAIYTPLHANPTWKINRGIHWMRVVGLIKSGVDLKQAQADFARVMINIGHMYPGTDAGRTVSVIPLHEEISGKADGPLKSLLLAVLILLTIACVNVAGLLLARGIKREREIALRMAVGAGRMRLVGQIYM